MHRNRKAGVLVALLATLAGLLTTPMTARAATDGPQTTAAPTVAGTQVITGQFGWMYRILPDGSLYGYFHNGWTWGGQYWTEEGLIGDSWNNFVHVVADQNVLYGIEPDGDLRWYMWDFQHDRWHPESGAVVGTGWRFKRVVAAGWGVLYGITDTGNLHWYARSAPDEPTTGWKSGSGKVVGNGWANLDHVTSCGGQFYTVDGARNLRSYYFSGDDDGTGTWTYHGIIGTSFRVYALGAGCSGVLYATMGNGDLRWYEYQNSTWNGPFTIGTGWV